MLNIRSCIMTLLSVILLLPVFFAIHELEEIIMMQRWVSKNRSTLYDRYPKIGFIIRLMEKVNTRGIAIIAAEEFVIVSACTFATAYTGNIVAWYCCLAAFGIHLVIHLFQFITWRRYIPAIVTSLLCLPYCIYAIYRISGLLTQTEFILYAAVGIAIGVINLLAMHFVVGKSTCKYI